MNVVIANRQRKKKINQHQLRLVVTELFSELKITNCELGIQFVSAERMAQINWQFLQHEGSTDVITFNHAESRSQLNGELFICVDDALSQAKEFGTTWQSELVRYVVHGVLHLCGYDDLKPHLRREMKRAENRLVRRLTKRFPLAELSRTDKLGA